MKHLNFLSKSSSQSCSHNVVTLASTVGSPSVHRRGIMLRLLSVLVLVLTFGVGNVWGADPTATFTAADQGWTGTSTKTQTIDGITFSFAGGTTNPTYYEANGLRTYENCKITISSSYTIKKIVFTYSNSNNGYLKNVTPATWDSSTKAWTGSATSISFTVGHSSGSSNGQVRITKIVVTYEGGCTGTKLGTPVVTAEASNQQVRLTWQAVSNASGYQLKWNGGDWAAATSPVTKTGLSNGTAYTYQVKAIGNGSTYCDGDASTEASAIPNVYHTVTWNNHGNTTTSLVVSGEKPTFPATPSSCDLTCTTFYGWATSAWSGPITSLTGKTIYLKASDMPDVTEDVTYYAVYSDASVTEYTFNSLSWGATSGGSAANWTSGKDANGFTSGQGVQVTSAKTGANATSPTSFTNVSRIVVTYNTNKGQGAGSIEMKIGTNSSVTNNVAWQSGDDGTCANYTTTFSYATTQSGNVKLTTNCTTNSIWVKSIEITSGSATQHYLTSCCTSLGSINGSFFWTTHFCPVWPAKHRS